MQVLITISPLTSLLSRYRIFQDKKQFINGYLLTPKLLQKMGDKKPEINDAETQKKEVEKNASKEAEMKTEVKTEEDEPINIEELLKLKIKLFDDSEVFLYSYGPKCTDTGEVRPLNCHLCRVRVIKDEFKRDHLRSQMHRRNLRRKIPLEKYQRPYRQFCEVNAEGNWVQFEIYPTENIPEITDEYKDRIVIKECSFVRPSAEVMDILRNEPLHKYNQKMPILGLDYVFKIKGEKKIHYHCGLCREQIKGEPFQHLARTGHQARYIVKHFPNTYAKVQEGLERIKNEDAKEQAIRNVFRYLYRKIENKKKRVQINYIDFDHFQIQSKREEIFKKINEDKHYGEDTVKISQPELEMLINKALKGKEIIEPDLKSLAKPELGYRSLILPKLKDQPKSASQSGPPPSKRSRKTGEGNRGNSVAMYKMMLTNILDRINAEYKMFEENPRTHPRYNEEWGKFWRRRCQELRRDKISTANHDFESEWAPFWIERLRKFYEQELTTRKRELKSLVGLPFDRSPSPFRQTQDQQQMLQPELMQWQNQQQPPQRSMFGAFNQERQMPIFTEDPPIIFSEPLSVISVMRLLSALEDQLGSLGPKAVELLSKAVLYEKNNGNTDELLIDNDYYVFFATVKEKFRGQLQANVVEPLKQKAVVHCLKDLTTLLETMEKALSVERERQRKIEEQEKRMQQQLQRQQNQMQQQQQQQQQKPQPLMNIGSGADGGMRSGGNNNERSQQNFRGNDNNQQATLETLERRRNQNVQKRKMDCDEFTSSNDAGPNWIKPESGFERKFSSGNDNSARDRFDNSNKNPSRSFPQSGNDNSTKGFGGINENFLRNFYSGDGNDKMSSDRRNTNDRYNSGRNYGGDNFYNDGGDRKMNIKHDDNFDNSRDNFIKFEHNSRNEGNFLLSGGGGGGANIKGGDYYNKSARFENQSVDVKREFSDRADNSGRSMYSADINRERDFERRENYGSRNASGSGNDTKNLPIGNNFNSIWNSNGGNDNFNKNFGAGGNNSNAMSRPFANIGGNNSRIIGGGASGGGGNMNFRSNDSGGGIGGGGNMNFRSNDRDGGVGGGGGNMNFRSSERGFGNDNGRFDLNPNKNFGRKTSFGGNY